MGSAELDPTTPVIIGVGQVTHHDRATAATVPGLLAEAAQRAMADTGAPGAVLNRLDTVGVAHCLSWPSGDPAAVLADLLGADVRTTLTTAPGGTGPLDLLHDVCAQIRSGADGIALLAGGEAIRSLTVLGADPQPQPDTVALRSPPPRTLGSNRTPSHPAEQRAGMFAPLDYYPLFETAIRAAGGWDGLRAPALSPVPPPVHQAWLGELWGRFAQVAATNPYAWNQASPSPAAIATPGTGNRMVAYPYPKLLTANIVVDQAAAILICSAATAAAAGVPRERWVFVAASAAAHDHWYVAERAHLHRSPAVAACGRAVLGHTGTGIDEIAHLDLYSCFPSAVQIAAAELGVDLRTRTPTVTGGLTFAGGPASTYAFHAVATLAERLRTTPQESALATAVGWFLTKHAMTMLTARPPARPYAHLDVQAEVDRAPSGRRRVVDADTGPATVEAWTVSYDRAGEPSAAYATCLRPDGARAVLGTTDPDTAPGIAAAMLRTDPVGTNVDLGNGGTLLL